MPTIPMGNFGQAVARPAQPAQIQQADPAGQAATRAAQTAQSVVADITGEQARQREADARQELQEARHEQRLRDAEIRRQMQQQREDADTAAGLKVLSEAEAALRRRRDEIGRQVLAGEIHPDKAADEWQTSWTKIVDEAKPMFPASVATVTAAKLGQYALTQGDAIHGAIATKYRDDTKANLLGTLEVAEREALGNRQQAVQRAEGVLARLGPAAGLGADDQVRELQRFKERTAFNEGSALVRGARDDVKSLDGVLARLKTPEFSDLDPARLGQLEQQVLARKQALFAQEAARVAHAEAVAARRDREAQAAITTADQLITAGMVPDQAMLAQLQGKVAGTSYAPVLGAMLQRAGTDAVFALKSPREQDAAILALENKARTVGTNPGEQRQLAAWQRIRDASKEQLADDPLVYGMKRGLTGPIQPMQMDAGGQVSLGQQLQERVRQAHLVQARTGQPVSPLLKDEAEQWRKSLDMVPPDARSKALADLSRAIGPSGVIGLAGQVEKADPALALQLRYSADPRGKGRYAADLIAAGAQAIKSGTSDKQVDGGWVVKPAEVKAWLASQLEGAIDDPQVAAQIRDGGELIAHGLAARKGGKFTNDDKKEVLRLAAGGTVEKYNEGRVLLPEGMTASDLKDRMKAVTVAELAPQVLPRGAGADGALVNLDQQQVNVAGVPVPLAKFVETLPDQQLVAVRPGVYSVRVLGRYVTNSAGRRIEIEAR